MSAHGFIRRVPPGTTQHKVLSLLLGAGAANLSDLHGACANDEPDVRAFRRRVLAPLRDRDLLTQVAGTKYIITNRGRIAIAGESAEPAARSRFEAKADPAELPLTPGIERWMLTSSQGRARSMTEADKAPAPVRSDGMEFTRHPSRRGNRLYYRDGRVTDMDGNPIEVGE